MTRTYRAVLSGDGIRWVGEVPGAVLRGEETPVEIVVSGESLPPGISGARLVEIFDELAELDPFREIEDPVAWQRELRQERPLPGRDDGE